MLRRWYLTVFSRDPELGGDLLVPPAGRDEAEDLELARRQAVGRRLAGRGPQARQVADDPGRGRRRDGGLAARDGLDHRPKLGRLEVLEQVAAGPCLDRGEQVLLVLADGEHHDRRLRPGRGDRPGRLDAGHPRHPDVHQDEVGLEPGDQLDGLAAVRGVTDHVMAPGLEQRRDPVTEQGVVVGQHDPHQAIPGTAGAPPAAATSAWTRQPPLGGLVQSTVAPMLSARSRIARSP